MALEGLDLRALLGEERPVFDEDALNNTPRRAQREHIRRLWASFASPLVFGEHVAGEATLVVSNGFSCREQIEQLGERETVHLAEALARALR